MAFVLNALIADLELLRSAPELVAVAIPGGRGLAPLTKDFLENHGHLSLPLIRGSESRLAPDDDFDHPDERHRRIEQAAAAFAWISALCVRLSATPGAAVAYVEAEFFGGYGGQAAAVWEAGQQVLGPLVNESAINQALARIGVERGVDDEFATLKLGLYRCTDEWLKLT